MLNGIDPILIFQFSQKTNEVSNTIARIPIISKIPTVIEQPPIPVYLSRELTGLYVDSEDKSVDISTEIQTLTNGEEPDVQQKGVGSSITVNLLAKKNSIGISLISALADRIFEKLSSKEYSVTYIHGPITIFRGVFQNFRTSQSAENDLLTISFEISRGQKQPEKKPEAIFVPKSTGAVPL